MLKLKKWIIILTTILIILSGALGFLIYKYRGKVIYGIDEEGRDIEVNIDNKLKKVSIRNNYYAVKTCVNKFYLYYSSMYDVSGDYYIVDEEAEASMQKEKQQSIEAVYNMLDDEYKSYKGLTLDNLTTKLPKIKEMSVIINDMYVSEKTNNIGIYFVYGNLIDMANSKTYSFSTIVKMDMINETFAIFLDDYIEDKYPNIKVGENVEIECKEKIEANQYNIFDYEIITDATYIEDIFTTLRKNMLYNKKIVYERLQEEYRAKRFPTYEKFEQYTKNNIRDLTIMKLSKYRKNNNGDSVQYVCLDSHNKYYIINENSTMDLTFILDTYTIDLPEFLTKYENSNESDKVALNIEKIKEAINSKDFEYFYNKLDNTFRNTKYSNYNNFENELKSKVFERNTFEYKKIENQGNVFIATVIVKNSKKQDETTEMRIVMKLTDTTDYSLSFSFER